MHCSAEVAGITAPQGELGPIELKNAISKVDAEYYYDDNILGVTTSPLLDTRPHADAGRHGNGNGDGESLGEAGAAGLALHHEEPHAGPRYEGSSDTPEFGSNGGHFPLDNNGRPLVPTL